MSERTVLVDEELAVDGIVDIVASGMEAVVLDGSDRIATVDDPRHLVDYGLGGGFMPVPAVLVPEGIVRGGGRLRVRVELVRGGDDG